LKQSTILLELLRESKEKEERGRRGDLQAGKRLKIRDLKHNLGRFSLLNQQNNSSMTENNHDHDLQGLLEEESNTSSLGENDG